MPRLKNIVLIPVASLGILACVNGVTPADNQEAIRLGSSSIGSTFYVISVGLAEMLGKHAGINATVEPLGGSDANMFALGANKIDIAVVNAGSAFNRYHGNSIFDKPLDVGLIAQGQESHRYILVRRDAGIAKPEDLVGQTVIGRRPSLPELEKITNTLIAEYGLPADKIHVVSTVTSGQTDNELRAGTVGAALLPGGRRMPLMVQLFNDGLVDFLYLPEVRLRSILAKMPDYFYIRKLPAGTFEGQEQDLFTPTMKVYLVAGPQVSEGTAYKIAKTLVENNPELASYHADGEAWTLENTLQEPKIPFHPGAIRYFKEAGVWTDELAELQAKLER